MTDLPILGAALTVDTLETHRALMLEKPRDLELQDFCGARVLDGDWRPKTERAKALLDGHQGRLGIHGPFAGFTIASPDPAIREVVTRRLLQGLEVCEALGADLMVLHSPYTTWDHYNLDNNEHGREARIELCHQTLDEVVRRAGAIGVVLVLENIEDKDPRDRAALAASFNSDLVKLSLDTGHAHYAHGVTGAPPVDYFIKAAGNDLAHIHLQDADGYADRHWTLGEGTVNWHAVFAALGALTSNPRLIIELRNHAGLPASIANMAALGLAQ